MTRNIDISPVEDVQAKLDQVKAFVQIIAHEYGHEHDATDLIATNLITLFDLVFDAHADLTQIIHAAYLQQPTAERQAS